MRPKLYQARETHREYGLNIEQIWEPGRECEVKPWVAADGLNVGSKLDGLFARLGRRCGPEQ